MVSHIRGGREDGGKREEVSTVQDCRSDKVCHKTNHASVYIYNYSSEIGGEQCVQATCSSLYSSVPTLFTSEVNPLLHSQLLTEDNNNDADLHRAQSWFFFHILLCDYAHIKHIHVHPSLEASGHILMYMSVGRIIVWYGIESTGPVKYAVPQCV